MHHSSCFKNVSTTLSKCINVVKQLSVLMTSHNPLTPMYSCWHKWLQMCHHYTIMTYSTLRRDPLTLSCTRCTSTCLLVLSCCTECVRSLTRSVVALSHVSISGRWSTTFQSAPVCRGGGFWYLRYGSCFWVAPSPLTPGPHSSGSSCLSGSDSRVGVTEVIIGEEASLAIGDTTMLMVKHGVVLRMGILVWLRQRGRRENK